MGSGEGPVLSVYEAHTPLAQEVSQWGRSRIAAPGQLRRTTTQRVAHRSGEARTVPVQCAGLHRLRRVL